MKASLHTSPDIFERLSPEWDGLLDPARSELFFLRNDWQQIWWRHLQWGDLAILAVYDDEGNLRGIAPWFIADDMGVERVVRTVGCTDVSDYMDIIAMPGFETPVIETLLDFMLSDEAPAWDRFSLCNIPASSPTCELFPRLANARGLTAQAVVQDVCPVIDLPGSYDEYLDGLDKKQRHELRRKRRRAEAAGVRWYVVGPEHDLDAEVDAFLELMAMSSPEKAGFLEAPGQRAFFHEIGRVFFEQDLLELIFLTVDGQRAAAMWQFAYRQRMLLYNSGLDPSSFAALSPGIVLLTYSIEDAIERGMATYDFLRGDEAYKYRMGARDTRVYNVGIRR